MKSRRSKETNIGAHKALTDDLNKVAYNTFIQTDGNVNYFSIGNFYDEERVKACYQSIDKLKQAYDETGHFFEVEPIIKEEIIDDKQLLRFANLNNDKKTENLLLTTWTTCTNVAIMTLILIGPSVLSGKMRTV